MDVATSGSDEIADLCCTVFQSVGYPNLSPDDWICNGRKDERAIQICEVLWGRTVEPVEYILDLYRSTGGPVRFPDLPTGYPIIRTKKKCSIDISHVRNVRRTRWVDVLNKYCALICSIGFPQFTTMHAIIRIEIQFTIDVGEKSRKTRLSISRLNIFNHDSTLRGAVRFPKLGIYSIFSIICSEKKNSSDIRQVGRARRSHSRKDILDHNRAIRGSVRSP